MSHLLSGLDVDHYHTIPSVSIEFDRVRVSVCIPHTVKQEDDEIIFKIPKIERKSFVLFFLFFLNSEGDTTSRNYVGAQTFAVSPFPFMLL